MISIQTLRLGRLKSNCYVVSNGTDCVLIDAGSDEPQDISLIKTAIAEKQVYAILCTHNHFDHISGVHLFPEIPCYMDAQDIALINQQLERARLFTDKQIIPPKQIQALHSIMQFGSLSFEVIATPGHTAGGVCFYFKEDGILFTGDTLFKNTYGRTDVGGNKDDMLSSLQKLASFPNETIIYPGHGMSSTIGNERHWILKLDRFLFM